MIGFRVSLENPREISLSDLCFQIQRRESLAMEPLADRFQSLVTAPGIKNAQRPGICLPQRVAGTRRQNPAYSTGMPC